MFEKEAEELIEESKRLNITPRETVCKAIEFGYNKAKKEIEEELLKCYQGYPEEENE